MGQVSVHQMKDETRTSLIVIDSDVKDQGIVWKAQFSLRFFMVNRVREEPLSANGH